MPSVFTSADPPNSAMRYRPSHRSTEAQNGWSTALWWCLWKGLETQTSTVKSTPSEISWPDFWSANQNSGQMHFWALSPERSGWWWKCFQHPAQREASHPAPHISQGLSQDYAPGFLIPSATFFPSCRTAFPAKWRQLHLSTYTSMF